MGGLLRIGCVLEGCDYGCFVGITGNKITETAASDVGTFPEGIVHVSGPSSECSVISRDKFTQTGLYPVQRQPRFAVKG